MITSFFLLLHLTSPGAGRQASACAACFMPSGQVQTVAETVSGTIRDSQGGVVAGALVIARASAGGELQTVTGSEGRFSMSGLGPGKFELIVRANGFAEKRQTIDVSDSRQNLALQLEPAGVSEAVTVSVTRNEQHMGDVPASVDVLDKAEIRRSPATVADDVLRQIPSFSLFRRTSSVAAHPTTQGVSLRGIGPSGVSRTLVLVDGVPANDPFGGWIYWSRIPIGAADRVEVVEGSSSSLYGNFAMGGLINVITAPPARRTLELKTQYGNENTPNVDVHASDVMGKLGISVDATTLKTDGYATLAPTERGPIDNNSTVDFKNVNVKADYTVSERVHAFARVGSFVENRNNGKMTTFAPITEEQNDTNWKSASGGIRILTRDQSEWQGTVFYDDELFHSNNVAVPDTVKRNVGRLSLQQTVPSRGTGGMVQWSRPLTPVHFLTAGADWRWVDGDSNELGFDATTGTTVTVSRSSGGTQQFHGFYFQDLITPTSKLVLTLSGRWDQWRNYDAHNLEVSEPSGAPTANNNPSLPGRQDSVASPRVAALYHVNPRLTLWGNAGEGFRAPTLNELYRGFRVGTKTTNPNPDLGPERLVGSEVGVSIAPVSHFIWRATAFDNRVRNPVANYTVSQTGANVVLQRRNLGRTRIWGVQTDAEYRLGAMWRFTAAYLYGISKVTDNPSDTTLVGKFLPEVPRHRASFIAAYTNPRWLDATATVQFVGRQFDDDQNIAGIPGQSFTGLPKYAVLGLSVTRQIGHDVEVFFAGQNLLNEQYYVGTLPSLVGSPRLVNGGLRIMLRGK